MGHFASEIYVRIDAIKHRTTRPRTDRNRSNLTWHRRSSDVDLMRMNTARDMQRKDSGREREKRTRGQIAIRDQTVEPKAR